MLHVHRLSCLVEESKIPNQCRITYCRKQEEDDDVTELGENPGGKKGINLSNVADLIPS
jgi:hypothetical protein